MRKVILSMFVSLDGYIEGPDGEFVPPDWSDDMQTQWADVATETAGLLVYGRKNFEFNAAYWQSAEVAGPFADKMNALPKLVVSSTLPENPGWNGRVVRGEGLAAEIARLKAEPGKDLLILGGADVAATFMGLGLVDRYHLLVTPILLGGGKRLFQGGYERTKLKPLSHRVMDTGAAILDYVPA